MKQLYKCEGLTARERTVIDAKSDRDRVLLGEIDDNGDGSKDGFVRNGVEDGFNEGTDVADDTKGILDSADGEDEGLVICADLV